MIFQLQEDCVVLKRNRQPNERLAISNNQHSTLMSTATIILRDRTTSVNRGNRFIDRIGRTYGQLTVIGLENCISGNARWKCKCSCGKEKSILARALNQGQISCGCVRRYNLIGRRFGRLVVKSASENSPVGKQGRTITEWNCVCDCGKVSKVASNSLLQGNTRSCGCLAVEVQRKIHTTHGATTGGIIREYRIWSNMKNRCSNPKSNRFHRYGGRGIKVCQRWMKFENFLNDMGRCPDGLTLERKDNNKGYEPSNCKWATKMEQANNMMANRILSNGGTSKTLAQWARETGIGYGAIYARLKRGWSIGRALTEPLI